MTGDTWLWNRTRDLDTRLDTLTDQLILCAAGAPVDLDWFNRRLRDVETRLRTIRSVMANHDDVVDVLRGYTDLLEWMALAAYTMAEIEHGGAS